MKTTDILNLCSAISQHKLSSKLEQRTICNASVISTLCEQQFSIKFPCLSALDCQRTVHVIQKSQNRTILSGSRSLSQSLSTLQQLQPYYIVFHTLNSTSSFTFHIAPLLYIFIMALNKLLTTKWFIIWMCLVKTTDAVLPMPRSGTHTLKNTWILTFHTTLYHVT